MEKIIALIAYVVYVTFCVRFLLHAIIWYKAEKRQKAVSVGSQKISLRMFTETTLDLIFFRRLFRTNKFLWIASWIFHVSFLLVITRHSWYFLNPVPDFIIFMQPAGIVAGHVLPFSLLLIVIIRISGNRDRYISYYNFFLTGILLMISLTGLWMRVFYQADLIDVKDFIMGLLLFTPQILPDNLLFVIHFLLVLLLLPYIPLHLLTAPIVTMEAKRREEGLDLVLHEK